MTTREQTIEYYVAMIGHCQSDIEEHQELVDSHQEDVEKTDDPFEKAEALMWVAFHQDMIRVLIDHKTRATDLVAKMRKGE